MGGISGGWTDNKAIQESRDTLQDLNKSIKEFNRQSAHYSRILIWLTTIMTLAVLIQIYLLLK